MIEDKDNLIRIKDLYKRSDETEERLETVEHNQTVMVGMVHTENGEDKIKELEEKIQRNYNRIQTLAQEILPDELDKLSAVIKGFITKYKNYNPNQWVWIVELLKKLDGATEGEPSTLKESKNDDGTYTYLNVEQEAPFPQPPISRDTSILEDVKVGEAEPHNPFMTMEHELKNKLIAEFLEDLSCLDSAYNPKRTLLNHIKEKWEGRAKSQKRDET